MTPRLSGLEALMWAAESEPLLRADFVTVAVVDRVPPLERLARRFALVAEVEPRLRRRVVEAPVPLLHPEWVDVEGFDPADHLARVRCPRPGGRTELLALTAELTADPLPRDRPLWRAWVVTGLARRRAALVVQFHHVLTDGVGGVALALHLLDAERDPPEPAWAAAAHEAAAACPPARRSTAEEGWRELTALARDLPLGALHRALGTAADLLRAPERAPGVLDSVTRTLRSAREQLLVTEPGRSSLLAPRTGERWLDALELPFGAVRECARRLGGSVNDVFVTGVTGALARYHEALGAPCAELRLAMPVNLRPAGDGRPAGNEWTNARVLVPLTPADPAARLAVIRERLAEARRAPVLEHTERLADLVARTPGALLRTGARQQTATVDFAASNVPGAPFELYLAGGRVEATFPFGPLGGAALNVTVLSYRDRLELGIVADRAAVREPERLAADLQAAFTELLAAPADAAPTPAAPTPAAPTRRAASRPAPEPPEAAP